MAKALVFRLPMDMDCLIAVDSDTTLVHYNGRWMVINSEFISTPDIGAFVDANSAVGIAVVDVSMLRPPMIEFVNGMN